MAVSARTGTQTWWPNRKVFVSSLTGLLTAAATLIWARYRTDALPPDIAALIPVIATCIAAYWTPPGSEEGVITNPTAAPAAQRAGGNA